MHVRQVGNRVLSFGVSGNLWNDALVMYDRQTGSLWSHVLGECIEGELLGTRLTALDAMIVRFEEWQERYPESLVLLRPAGSKAASHYQSYAGNNERQGIFGTLAKRDELEPKAVVQGMTYGGGAIAIAHRALADGDTLEFTLQEQAFTARRVGTDFQIWKIEAKGERERYPSTTAYWFGWINFYPRTQLIR